jgi:heterotetrameric sarcosine oxidase delta subunit
MSFYLICPHCGPREVYEFRYGGEILDAGVDGQLAKSNQPGWQRERWYHRFGCRRWLFVERNISTHEVRRTGLLEENG